MEVVWIVVCENQLKSQSMSVKHKSNPLREN